MTDIITMPEALYSFAEIRFNLTTINQTSEPSSFNPLVRINGASAEFWQADFVINPSDDEDQIDEIDRFVSKLYGGKVLARIYDLRRGVSIRGAGGATSTVNMQAAADAGATSITIKNLLPNEAVALHAMDRIGIGENLYRVTDSSPSDANGRSTVSIRPALRLAVAAGDAVSLSKPTGLFRLMSGEDQLTVRPPIISGELRLSFTEDPLVE